MALVRKRFTWPAYAATLRSRTECRVVLLVVTPFHSIADWAGTPIDLGPNGIFQPIVLGPDHLASLVGTPLAKDIPEMAVLAAIAAANTGGGPSEALAALKVLAPLDPERSTIYADAVLSFLGETGRKALEELMSTGRYEYQSDFAKKFYRQGLAEGEARGRAEGEARGRAAGVLAVLALRGLRVSDEQRARIEGSGDPAILERWLARAADVDGVDELFD